MKKVKLFESFLSEANKGKVHKAAKQGSYPAVVVVVQDGKVIHQEPVSTPEVAPATFNVMQEKYPKALLHLEDKTGKRLFSESVVTGFTEAKMTKDKLENLIYSLENENDSWHPSSDSKKKAMLDKLKKDLSKFESLVIEKREDVGKYNTVKKVINKLGRRPSEQDLATFINNNYYDVTEVERGDNDERADDKIADLVGFYKFDIEDWEIAWADAQNESAVIESGMSDIHMFAKDAKNINDFLKTFFKEFGDKVKKTPDTIQLAKELYNGMISESLVTEAKNTIGLAFKEEQDYLDFKEFVAEQPRGAIRKNIGFDSKTKSWNVEMDVKVLDSIYGEGTPSDKKSGWYGGLPDDFESVIIESVVTEASKSNLKKGDKLKFTDTGEIIFIIEPKGDGYDFKLASDPREKDHAPKSWFDMMIKRGKLVSESVVTEAAYANATQNELAEYIISLSNELKYAKANKDKKEIKFLQGDIAEVKAALAKMKNESVVTEGIIYTKDDLVYNKKTKMVNIVRVGNDTYSDVSTDSSGNVPVSHIEKYNPIKNKHQQNAKVSADTEKEITKRGLFNPFKNESVVTEGIFDSIADPIKALHFETDPKTAELMKMELGKKQGETNKKKQIDSAEYSLRRFRKSIKFGDGTYLGVFLPGSYDASVSTLGDGPHKKAVAKVKWNQKKYDQWLEDMAANGGADNAFDMAQNAKNETGLIDWVKKEFRGEDPLQRIQWDIEAFAESVVTEARPGTKTYYHDRDVLPPHYGNSELHDKSEEMFKKSWKKLNDKQKDEVLSSFPKNESVVTEAKTYKLKASEFGSNTFSAAYNVKGETTWRVHSTYAIDQVSGENDADERDVVFFEAMPINNEIYIKIGGINNLKRTGATVGDNFGTTIEEWKKDPKGIAKEASEFLTDATHLKWINKKARSQGQTIKWALKDDYSSVIEDLVNKSLALAESLVTEASEDKMIKQIERALKDGTSIFKLPMDTQKYYNKNKSNFVTVTEAVELVHVYGEDGKMFGTGELVKTKGKKSLIRWDGSKEEWIDSKLVKLVESFKKFKDHIASINDGSGSTAEVYFNKGKGYYVVVSGEYDYDFDAKDKKELTKKLKDNEFTNEPFEGSI